MILLDEERQTITDELHEAAAADVRQPFLAGWMAGFRFCLVLFRRKLDYQGFKPERRQADMQRDLRAFLMLKDTMEQEPEGEQQLELDTTEETTTP